MSENYDHDEKSFQVFVRVRPLYSKIQLKSSNNIPKPISLQVANNTVRHLLIIIDHNKQYKIIQRTFCNSLM